MGSLKDPHTGQTFLLRRNSVGVFLCYCSHPKCPKPAGFCTMDSLYKHLHTAKSQWLGPEAKQQV